MADINNAVQIVFNAVDNTAAGMASVSQGLSNFAETAQGAVSPLNSIADAVKLTDTAIVALGLAFGGAALNAAGQFNGKIAEIGTLFKGTSDQVGQFRGDVLAYASDSTKSLDDIAGALYTAVSAGIEWGKSIEFVGTAEKLAVAGQGDLTSATNVLAGAMNAYGASADEAAKYSDILMQTVLIGQTTLPELAQSLSQVTSTAAAAGVSFSDVNAAVAALTAAGIPTTQAMTAIQAAIAGIIKPSKDAQETAAGLGLSFNAQALSTKGLDGVLKEVYQTTGGNVEVMAKLFGSMEALKAVTALGADKSGIYAKALDAMANSAGSVDAAFAVLAQNWDAQLAKMSNSVDVFMISVGSKLNEGGEFSGLLTAIKAGFQGLTFSIGAGAFDSVFDTLQGIATRLADFMSQIAKNLPAALEQVDFTKFNNALKNLADSLGGLFDGIDLSTPEGLARAIQLVVDSIANLLNQGAGIAQTWGALLDAALPVVEAFAGMSQGAATASGKMLGFGDILTLLLPGLGAIGQSIEAVGNGLELLAGSSILKTVTGLSSFGAAAGTAGTAASALATALGPAVLVGAAGAAGYAVGTVLNAGINAAVDTLTGSGSLGGLIYDLTHDTELLADAAPKGADGLRQVGDAASGAAEPTQRLRDTVMELRSATTDVSKLQGYSTAMLEAAVAAGEATSKTAFLAQAALTLKAPTEQNKTLMNNLAAAYKDTASWAGHTADASKLIRTEYEKLNPPSKELNANLKTSSGVMEELSKKTDLTSKDLITLAKNTQEAEYKLESLASNERIKNTEAVVRLDIANVEANAKIAVAAFESIGETVNSTGALLGDLFGLFKDFDDMDWSTQNIIEKQIDLENKRRDDALKLQKELTEAQIRQIDAQVEAMNNGDGLIKITGDGLQPHLEAFMWEILKTIQVRVSSDGLKLLLGV